MKMNKLFFSNKIVLKGCVFMALTIMIHSQILFSQDTIPDPPYGYDFSHSTNPHGTTEVVSYYSSFVGVERDARIYFPPEYNTDSTYNVLYLLHGIGGDINEWYNNGAPNRILDNLYAKGKIAPMIVVMPNGRAMEDDSPGSDIYDPEKVEGFANFEFDLITDLIPFIDTTYPVKPGREARAIAGLSMGGGQALNFGLGHLDTFAWVGSFSAAPNTRPVDSLIPNLAEDTAKIGTLWISCGGADDLLVISENVHNFMSEHNIDHYYWVQPGRGHDWSVWRPGLYHFTQRIFGKEYEVDTTTYDNNDDNNTGLLQHDSDSDINFFYNPSEQTITFQGYTHIKSLSIYDINGRLRLSYSNVTNNTLNINQLKNGVYFVVLSDGKRNLHGKILKM
jgi:enterochelin esterase-like enzyme